MRLSMEWLASTAYGFQTENCETGYAHLRHYTAEFQTFGVGRPLVLIPGLAGGLGLVAPLARSLSRHFRVISFQLRGESDCFVLRRRFGLGDLVDDVAEFLDFCRLERPILMGVSFGGVLALEMAVRNPGRLGAVALQGVGSRFEPGLLQRIAGTVLTQYPLPNDNPFVNQFFNVLFGGRQEPGPMFDFVTRNCWQTDQSVMAHRFQLVQDFDCRDRLSRVCVPTLILRGDRDVLVSKRSTEQLHQCIESSRVVTLEGNGHLAFVSQPERVADAVAAFLANTNAPSFVA